MSNPVFNNFNDIEIKEIAPGYFSKLIHTDNNTINFIAVKAGNSVPLHTHIHQQMCFVLEGLFELTVNGEARQLDKSQYAIVPPNVEHGGLAITDCKLIDIFSPVREDYKGL